MTVKTQVFDVDTADGSKEGGLDQLLIYWHAVLNYRWVVLTVALLAMTYGFFTSFRQDDYYIASTKLIVHELEQKRSTSVEDVNISEKGENYYQTQKEIMKSLEVCEEAVRLGELDKEYGTPTVSAAAKRLRASANVTLLRGTRIYVISVQDGKADRAAKGANALAEAFIRQTLKERLFVSEQVLKWFPDQAKSAQASNPMEMFKKLDDQEQMMSLPSVMTDPSIKRLRDERVELEAKKRELLTNYTEIHPKVKEVANRLSYVESEILIQARRVTESLRNSLTRELNISNIKIIEPAETPRAPAGPDRMKDIITKTLMGLAGGVGLVIFIQTLDRTVKTDEDLMSTTDLPLLGQIPIRLSKNKDTQTDPRKAFEYLLNDPVTADAFATLKTALIFSMPKGLNKLIMVTSSIPGEGKSTTAHLLAASFAKLGDKTLLVELDLRRPSLYNYLEIKNWNGKGMSDLLVGNVSLEEIVVQSPITPLLYLVPAGSKSPNPTVLFASPMFEDFLNRVTDLYDRVIIDTPPSFTIPDSHLVATKIHGMVFVVGAGKVHRKVVQKTLHKFQFGQALIFGTVLNQVSMKTSTYYEKYRHDNYGREDASG